MSLLQGQQPPQMPTRVPGEQVACNQTSWQQHAGTRAQSQPLELCTLPGIWEAAQPLDAWQSARCRGESSLLREPSIPSSNGGVRTDSPLLQLCALHPQGGCSGCAQRLLPSKLFFRPGNLYQCRGDVPSLKQASELQRLHLCDPAPPSLDQVKWDQSGPSPNSVFTCWAAGGPGC